MSTGVLIRRIDDRALDKGIRHRAHSIQPSL
jgi:hypothetical protein